ncbi:hypothetical protein KL86DYS2_12498 [uncultured Dysgonomonas sp.]|uniref:Uncharacterized protein n=1 Tax=uncultured Dysgonomonas sp. TaxID=206096 RepID=A0A212JWH4_9BACT|nr:hypothetical protein KL86DYS2_12498 [uncultured Dysgonomonas sp.]
MDSKFGFPYESNKKKTAISHEITAQKNKKKKGLILYPKTAL